MTGKRPPPAPAGPQAVTVAQLEAARSKLGPVGVRPFATYVRKTYGSTSEKDAREFLGGKDIAQIFAPAPSSKGNIVAVEPLSDWTRSTYVVARGRVRPIATS